MAKIGNITVGLIVEYRFVFFPLATYKSIDNLRYLIILFGLISICRYLDSGISLIKIFGFNAYKRVGAAKWLLGYSWGSNAAQHG